MPIDPDFAHNYRRAWAALSESRGQPDVSLQEERVPDRRTYIDVFRPEHAKDEDAIRRAGEIVQKYGVELIRAFPTASVVAVSFKYVRGKVEPIPSITFFVGKKLPEHQLRDRVIPKEIEGVPTDVIEAGVPRLQQVATSHTPGTRARPAQPGMSIAHTRVTSGTFGCLLEDDNKNLFILSCAHVLSDAAALAGEAILQPAPHYGGVDPQDRIGRLKKTIPLSSGTCVADAGIAAVDPSDVSPDVLNLGKPTGVRILSGLGLSVQKSGDQTGVTPGIVAGIKATVGPLQINGASNVFFNDAIVTTGMSDGGDSGSLLMDNRLRGIGILFGGLASGSQLMISWYNPLEPILNHFGLNLVT